MYMSILIVLSIVVVLSTIIILSGIIFKPSKHLCQDNTCEHKKAAELNRLCYLHRKAVIRSIIS